MNTENVRGGLSRNESLLLSSLSEKGKSIFRLRDVREELRCTYEYAKVLTNNLAKKRWIIVLSKGKYLIVPLSAGARPSYTEHEFAIAAHLVSPCYIGYWSALNFHEFTEQIPLAVFVGTTKRAKDRKVLNVNFRFITLKERKFFGFTQIAIGPFKVNISDPEKTIADALDHPEYCGGIGEVAKCVWNAREKVSFEKALTYAEKMGNTAIIKRLGYLVEHLKMDMDSALLTTMRRAIAPGISMLDPTRRRTGSHITRWNLLVNVPKESLEEWRRIL